MDVEGKKSSLVLMVTDALSVREDIRLAKEKVSDDQLPEKIGETVRISRTAVQEAVETFLNDALEALVLFEALGSAECHKNTPMEFNIGGLLDDLRAYSSSGSDPDIIDRRRSIAKRFLS